MAVWQWDVWIVPRNRVLQHFSVVPEYVDQDWFESIDWWNDILVDEWISFFDRLLPSLSNSGWGKPDATFVSLLYEDGKVANVFVRIDVRDVEQHIIQSLIDFARSKDLLFFGLESNRFIEPDWSAVISGIKTSRAYQFVDDPEGFLSDRNYLNKINKEIDRKIEREDSRLDSLDDK